MWNRKVFLSTWDVCMHHGRPFDILGENGMNTIYRCFQIYLASQKLVLHKGQYLISQAKCTSQYFFPSFKTGWLRVWFCWNAKADDGSGAAFTREVCSYKQCDVWCTNSMQNPAFSATKRKMIIYAFSVYKKWEHDLTCFHGHLFPLLMWLNGSFE